MRSVLRVLSCGTVPRSAGWGRRGRMHGLHKRRAPAPSLSAGRVLLLTTPVSAGYVQNPISVYYCYNRPAGGDAGQAQRLHRGIAEVRAGARSAQLVRSVVCVCVCAC